MSAESPEPAAAPRRWQRLVAHARTDARRLVTTGVPHLFVALAFTQGISLIRRVLLTGILTLEELGQMTYVTQIADLISIAADLGITTAVLKYAAEPVDDRRRRELYVAGLFWSSVASCTIAGAYCVVIWLLGGLADSVQTYLLIVTPYVAISAVLRIPLVFMQALRDIRRSARYTALTQAVSLLLLVGATYWFRLPGFFATLIIAPALNLALLLHATRGYLVWSAPRLSTLRELLGFGFFSVLANLAGFANGTMAVILLKRHTASTLDPAASDAVVGVLGIGLLVVNAARLVPSALLQTAFPYLSGLVSDPARLRRRMWELSAKQGLVLAGVLAGWLLMGRWVLTILWGAEKAAAFAPATILLVGLVVFAVSSPAGQTLLVLGRVRLNFAFGLSQLGTNVAASLLLLPRFGPPEAYQASALALLIGQCVDSTLALFAAATILRRAVARRAQIPPTTVATAHAGIHPGES